MFLTIGLVILAVLGRRFVFGSESDTPLDYLKTAGFAAIIGIILSVAFAMAGCMRWLIWIF